MSRADIWNRTGCLPALLCSAALLSPVAMAGSQPDPQEVQEAFALQLANGDLDALMDGLSDSLFDGPVHGTNADAVRQDLWFTALTVEGLSWSIDPQNIQVVPGDGTLTVRFDIRSLDLNVRNIRLGRGWLVNCDNTRMSSGDGSVPVELELVPAVEDRRLVVRTRRAMIGLSAANFQVAQPETCHGLPLAAWIARRALPMAIQLARGTIARTVAQRAAAEIETLADGLNRYLIAGMTWPFEAPPAPPFYATMSVWPSSLRITPDTLNLRLGASVAIDPDPVAGAGKIHTDTPAIPKAGLLPSWMGVATDLLKTIIAEARTRGVFRFRIDPDQHPALEPHFTVGSFNRFLPGLSDLVTADARLTVRTLSSEDSQVVVRPEGPGGIPIIEMLFAGTEILVEVEGGLLLQVHTSLRISLEAGYLPRNGRFTVRFLSLSALDTQVHVLQKDGDSLSSHRSLDFDPEAFSEFVADVSDSLHTARREMFSVQIPELGVGAWYLDLAGSSVRDGFITVDGAMRPRR